MRTDKDLRQSSSKFPYQKGRQDPGRLRLYFNENFLNNIFIEKNDRKN